MRIDLDISLIRAFLAVVDADGVTAAASALGISQAAASQQIKRLEEALDCRLFERQGRKLVLAPAGERLLAQARRLLALNDEVLVGHARAAVRGRGPPRRALRHHRQLRAAHPAPLRQGAAARARQPGVRGFEHRAQRSCARAASISRSPPRPSAAATARPCAPTGWCGSACRAARRICAIRCRCRSARRPACSVRSRSRRWARRGATGARSAR